MDSGRRTATEFGALDAFLPAVLSLAGDLPRARRLGDSCFRMWNLKGVEPELIDYRTMKILSPGYRLRPEIMESTFALYRATHDQRYQEMGRTFLEALVRRCRTDAGFTVLTDVVSKKQGDLMPSYFLAETLKYLYLLFAPDDTLDLDTGRPQHRGPPAAEDLVNVARLPYAPSGRRDASGNSGWRRRILHARAP